MKVSFTLGNHGENGYPSVMDIIKPFMAGLTELGHEVELTTGIEEGDGLLVLTDYFIPPVVEIISRLKRPYAVIQSELITGKTFNNESMFARRYDNFMRVCDNAEFVVYLVGDSNVQCPAFKCELGYSALMEDTRDIAKEFDICFYGTPSVKRMELLQILSELGNKVVMCQNASSEDRDTLLKKSRWNMGLKPHWDVRFPSVSRINTALHCHVPTLYEHTESDNLVGSIPLTHDGQGSFLDWVDAILKDRDKDAKERDNQVEAFKCIPMASQLKAGFESIKYAL